MATTPTLVLDLDGTLVDTAADLAATLNVILRLEGLRPIPFEDCVTMVGYGARAMLASALKVNGLTPEPERLDNLNAAFLDHYSRHIADQSRAFPGAVESLDRFAAAGWRIAMCTNKTEVLARQLLAEIDLDRHFVFIAGQDTFGVRKPDPRHLTETIRAAGGDARRAVMVGDSEIDIAAAKAASVPVIAVTFGYSPVPVSELGADRVIGHFDALYQAASDLLPG